MSEQIALAGFEPPYEKELTAYNSIFPRLRAAAEEIGANAAGIKIVHNQEFSSVWYASLLVFRLRHRSPAVFQNCCSGERPSGPSEGSLRWLLAYNAWQ